MTIEHADEYRMEIGATEPDEKKKGRPTLNTLAVDGERLKRLLYDRRFTQRELAQALPFSFATLKRIIGGGKTHARVIESLADVLDVDPAYLSPEMDPEGAKQYQMKIGGAGCASCHNKRQVIESLRSQLKDARDDLRGDGVVEVYALGVVKLALAKILTRTARLRRPSGNDSGRSPFDTAIALHGVAAAIEEEVNEIEAALPLFISDGDNPESERECEK